MKVLEKKGYGKQQIIYDVLSTSFDPLEESLEVPVVLYFWASWCTPCSLLTPILENALLSMEQPIRLAWVDVDKEQQMANRFDVKAIPSVILFREGGIVERFTGVQKKEYVQKCLKRSFLSPAKTTNEKHNQKDKLVQSEPIAEHTALKSVKPRSTAKKKNKVVTKQQKEGRPETTKRQDKEKQVNEGLMRMKNIEDFIAYAGLIAEYCPEMQDTNLKRFTTRFVALINEQSQNDCMTPRLARHCCSALEQRLFAEKKDLVDYYLLCQNFTEKIKKAIETDAPEAKEWIRFFAERSCMCIGDYKNWAIEDYKNWANECFYEVLPECSESLAQYIFSALNNGLPGDKKMIEHIEKTALPKEQRRWALVSYRRALWSCKLETKDKEKRLSEYLRDVFSTVKGKQDLFKKWVDIIVDCSNNGIDVLGNGAKFAQNGL